MKFTGRFFLFFLFSWLVLSLSVQAQKPRKLVKKAEKAFFNDDLPAAISLYEQAVALQPADPALHYRLGQLYRQQNQPAKALAAFENAIKNTPAFNRELTLVLAQMYHEATAFAAAITQYQLLLEKTPKDKTAEIALYQKRIREAESGMALQALPQHAQVKNPGSQLNSPGDDMAAVLINDDTRLVFVSVRNTYGTRRENEDIYEAVRTPEGWSEPKAFRKPLNTNNPDAVTYITPDGATFYVFVEKNNGDIAEVTRTGADSFSKPQLLDDPINSADFEPSFFITRDKQFAFFASDRPEGFGGLDLYLTMRQPDGSWSEALNLGSNINTPYDEDAPFISEDGSTLYFSSRGHNSMGGYDIFRSSSQGITWSPAENLGFPVNSPFNDTYFIKTTDGTLGYFTSDRAGGLGQKDIYEASFRSLQATDSLTAAPEPVLALETPPTVSQPDSLPVSPREEPALTQPEPVVASAPPVKEADQKPVEVPVTIFGKVTDAATKAPLAAQITFSRRESKGNAVTAAAPKRTGDFGAVISRGRPYEMLVEAEGYFFVSETLMVPEFYSGDSLRRDVKMRKIKAGANLVLKNVFFEYNSHVLTESSRQELEKLVTLMKGNENIRVEISGHTDNKGQAAYNQALSLKRAQAVIDFLVSQGINKSRLVAQGLGSAKPIATNQTEAGRKLNRRTEFKVLSE